MKHRLYFDLHLESASRTSLWHLRISCCSESHSHASHDVSGVGWECDPSAQQNATLRHHECDPPRDPTRAGCGVPSLTRMDGFTKQGLTIQTGPLQRSVSGGMGKSETGNGETDRDPEDALHHDLATRSPTQPVSHRRRPGQLGRVCVGRAYAESLESLPLEQMLSGPFPCTKEAQVATDFH